MKIPPIYSTSGITWFSLAFFHNQHPLRSFNPVAVSSNCAWMDCERAEAAISSHSFPYRLSSWGLRTLMQFIPWCFSSGSFSPTTPSFAFLFPFHSLSRVAWYSCKDAHHGLDLDSHQMGEMGAPEMKTRWREAHLAFLSYRWRWPLLSCSAIRTQNCSIQWTRWARSSSAIWGQIHLPSFHNCIFHFKASNLAFTLEFKIWQQLLLFLPFFPSTPLP